MKPEGEFYTRRNPNNTTTVYRMSACKLCMAIRADYWIETNRDKRNSYQSDYYKKHPKEFKVYQDKSYDKKRKHGKNKV